MLLSTDDQLWWLMLVTGVIAAGVSISASVMARLNPERRTFSLHVISYIFLSVSMLLFALRGLMS